MRTTDGGQNWVPQQSGTTMDLWGVSFSDADNGFAVGNWGTILRTTDGGQNWLNQRGITGNHFSSVSAVDPSTAIAVANFGTIVKTTNGGATFIEQENNQTQPSEFLLSQNYPNPFNPRTTIPYTIPLDERREAKNVTLIVYDVLGTEVATLVDEEKSPGNYEVEFESTIGSHQLASGIYFYQLKAGDYISTKKMILMK